MHATRAGCLLALALVSCGDRTIDLDRVCVRARILPIAADMITRSGRTLNAWDGWSVHQIETDGSLTMVTSLAIDLEPPYLGYLEHDPVSGRMWLIAWDHDQTTWLYQFDAAGQVEWADALDDFEHPTRGGAVLYHDDSIVLAVTVQPEGFAQSPRLVVERRNLAGDTLWTRAEIPTQDGDTVFASGQPIGVSNDALSMIVTPPLIDYGPSFPLTLDITTGTTIWSGADGHDPLRMIADDELLFVAWNTGPFWDFEQLPPYPEIDPLRTSLARITPSGEISTQAEIEWPKQWRREVEDDNLALAWMGDRVVTLVQGTEQFGVTVHNKDGTLECQGKLDVEIVSVRAPVGIKGRAQWLAEVDVPYGEPNEYGEYDYERRILLLEPL